MKEKSKAVDRSINWVQISIGVVVLAVGSLIYLIDRSPDQTYFVYTISTCMSLHHAVPILFAPLGRNLPAFIHCFPFHCLQQGYYRAERRDISSYASPGFS